MTRNYKFHRYRVTRVRNSTVTIMMKLCPIFENPIVTTKKYYLRNMTRVQIKKEINKVLD